MSFTLPTQEEKAEYVLRQFDRIARRYDLANDCISMGMHRFWKERAVKELSIKVDGNYLDVCCGTGDLSLILAKKLAAAGKVIGLDFSPNMLDIAERRAGIANQKVSAKMEWIKGDAQNLPFPDDTFDGAVISFGLRNLTDFERGIAEMARVTKPGGTVINLDLGKSEVPLFAPLFKFYFGSIVPIIGEIIQSDRQAYTYLPQSASIYPAPDGITDLFQKAGLIDIKHLPLALGSVALHKGTVPTRSKTV